MSRDLLVVSEVDVRPADVDAAVRTWRAHLAGVAQLYRSVVGTSLLELLPVDRLRDIVGLRGYWRGLWDILAPALAGDFRRQVHEFVEAPKDVPTPLQDTPYVQLRRVEVKPPVIHRYREWRERTIFETVRQAPEVEAFLTYHSVLSAEPGVLFVSGFSDPDKHDAVFQTPEYAEILRQARENYIVVAGGDRGLFTRSYQRVED